jgi:hypothetical protein
MCKAIHFFEGELRLIAECLRCAGPQKVAKQSTGSTHGVATREEIEKYTKKNADRRVIDAGRSAEWDHTILCTLVGFAGLLRRQLFASAAIAASRVGS